MNMIKIRCMKITKEKTKAFLKDKWHLRNLSTKHRPLAYTRFAHVRAQILSLQTFT